MTKIVYLTIFFLIPVWSEDLQSKPVDPSESVVENEVLFSLKT